MDLAGPPPPRSAPFPNLKIWTPALSKSEDLDSSPVPKSEDLDSKGQLSHRAKMMVMEWALEHREELLANWNKARIPEPLDKIQPLE